MSAFNWLNKSLVMDFLMHTRLHQSTYMTPTAVFYLLS